MARPGTAKKVVTKTKRKIECDEVARVNVLVPPDVAQWLEVYAVTNGMTVAYALTELVRVHMGESADAEDSD